MDAQILTAALGIALTLVGIAVAFEAPRRWFLSLARRRPEIEHDFKVRTVFHAHNEGKALGLLGTNKTEKKYFWYWTIRNHSRDVLQMERGIVMRQATQGMPALLLTPPEFTEAKMLFPGHSLQLLSIELTPRQIDHYRHWVRECTAFGVKLNGKEYWIDIKQFVDFGVSLQNIAKEYGLAEMVREGKMVTIKFVRKG